MKTENNQKLLMISLITLLLVGVILLGVRFVPAVAAEILPNHYALVSTNEPHLINDNATEIAILPDVEYESGDQDPAALLKSMVRDFENNMFSQPGWLHYVYYQESEVSNGVALPQNYFVDGWYLINEAGIVTQDVVSYYDDDGNLNQRGIFKDNTFINLSTKEEIETEGPYKLKLDLGVTKYMLEMETEGSILTHEVTTLDENPVIIFSVLGNYPKGYSSFYSMNAKYFT